MRWALRKEKVVFVDQASRKKAGGTHWGAILGCQDSDSPIYPFVGLTPHGPLT
jgi:hypothetical protein